MKSFLCVTIIGISLIGCISVPKEVHAQSPSYEDTRRFIIDKFAEYNGKHMISNTKVGFYFDKYIKIDEDCDFEIINIWRDPKSKRVVDTITHIGRFSRFDPSTVNVQIYDTEGPRLSISTMNGEKAIKYTHNGKVEYQAGIYPIAVKPPYRDNAPRLEKAMKHIISLCGGKEQLF